MEINGPHVRALIADTSLLNFLSRLGRIDDTKSTKHEIRHDDNGARGTARRGAALHRWRIARARTRL